MQEIIKKFEAELRVIQESLKNEILSLRTNRATPALVENIEVSCYGGKSLLPHIASISTPDARTILISPWDKGILGEIQNAIEKSELHLAPIVDADHIRIMLPSLTEERRRDLIKLLGSKMEEARVKSRRARDDAWKIVQALEKEKTIAEDAKFKAKDELQKQIDAFNAELAELQKKKEQDIMEV